MRRTAWFVAAMLAAAPSALAAQTGDHPNLILSIQGGVLGGTDLWHVPRQLLLGVFTGTRDTVSLGRRITSGITALASATYFQSPNFGYYAELGYFGISTEGQCAGIGQFTADSLAEFPSPNQKACEATNGATYPTSLAALQAGVVYRAFPNANVSPYVRATVGGGALSNSFVDAAPVITSRTACDSTVYPNGTCSYALFQDTKRPSFTWVATLAIGNTIRLSPGYNVRIEARDLIASLPIAADSGSVSGVATAKPGWRVRHMIGLTIGLDVILERSHRRRY